MCYSNWSCKHFDPIRDQENQEVFYSGALIRSMYPGPVLDDWEVELAKEAEEMPISNVAPEPVIIDGTDLDFEDGDIFVIENQDGSFTAF